MDIDANINIEIDDSDIVDAVRSELGDFVDSRIDSYDRDNPLHDRMDWDSAARSGQMTFEHTDDDVRSLIREVIELNPEVLRDVIAQQIEAALKLRMGNQITLSVQDIVRAEITKWGQSFGNVLANMTHDYNKGEDQ
jgi:hypothetical protein